MNERLRVFLNLGVFTLIFGALLVWAAQNVVSVDRLEHPYHLTVEADAASGVARNAEVAYLGVHYGRVTGVDLLDDGVRINMLIDHGREIPRGSTPRIFRKSAIGEAYIDFQPPDDYDPDTTPAYAADTEVPIRASVPLEFSELLRTASNLISRVEPDRAATLLDELAQALDGRGEDLRRFTVATDELVQTFADRTDVLDRLAENNTRLTHVFTEHRGALGSTITDLSLLAESLRNASGDTQVLLDRGTALLATTADLVEDSRADIDCLLGDLVPVMAATSTDTQLDTLRHYLETGPAAFGAFYSTIDREPDGIWVRVNLQVDLSSPPPQYVPPLPLPAVHAEVACPNVSSAATTTATPTADFRPSDVLGSGRSTARAVTDAALARTGASQAGWAVALLLAVAFGGRRLARRG